LVPAAPVSVNVVEAVVVTEHPTQTPPVMGRVEEVERNTRYPVADGVAGHVTTTVLDALGPLIWFKHAGAVLMGPSPMG